MKYEVDDTACTVTEIYMWIFLSSIVEQSYLRIYREGKNLNLVSSPSLTGCYTGLDLVGFKHYPSSHKEDAKGSYSDLNIILGADRNALRNV